MQGQPRPLTIGVKAGVPGGLPWNALAGDGQCGALVQLPWPGTTDSWFPWSVPVMADLWPLPWLLQRSVGLDLSGHLLYPHPTPAQASWPQYPPCVPLSLCSDAGIWAELVPSTLRGSGTQHWAKCQWQSRRELPPLVFSVPMGRCVRKRDSGSEVTCTRSPVPRREAGNGAQA